MKVLLTAWLVYNGSVVSDSIVQRQFNSMTECVGFGEYVAKEFDGVHTYHKAYYVCTEKGMEI